MSEDQNQIQQDTQIQQDSVPENNPWPLYIMLAMVVAVLVSGYLLSPKTEDGKLAWIELLGTTNKGILMNPPVEVLAEDITTELGQPWQPLSENTWKFLVVNTGACEETCINRLKELHAMRIRLHRDAHRLAVGLLSDQPQQLPADVAAYTDINMVRFTDSDLLSRLQQTNIPSLDTGPVVLMLNPIDVFMMAYSSDHIGSEMLEDLEHLMDLAH